MSKDVVGSVRNVTIEGISFRCAADTNISRVITIIENSRIPTSGKSMRKMVRRIPAFESVVLAVNASEIEQLKSFAESLNDLTMSVETAAGDQYKSTGTIEVENVDTDEGKASCQLLPAEDWTPFVAS